MFCANVIWERRIKAKSTNWKWRHTHQRVALQIGSEAGLFWRRSKTPNSDVRNELASSSCDSDVGGAGVDRAPEPIKLEIATCSDPKLANRPSRWEMAEASQLQLKRELPQAAQSLAEIHKRGIVNIAKKAQRKVHILGRLPAGMRQPTTHAIKHISHFRWY